MRFVRLATAALAAFSLHVVPAAAQDYPNRTIKIMVGFGAGGGTDLAARIMAQALQEQLGQSVVVENKPGGGGAMAADMVAKAPKDGYTLLMMSNAHAVAPAVNKTLPFDSVKDFQMLSMVGTAGLVMVTAPEFPANDLKGAIAVLKADPEKFNYGTPGDRKSTRLNSSHT